MSNKALIFDISTKRMKEDKLTDSEITRVYSTIAKELQSAGFDDRIQQSVYRTTNGDGINSLLTLLSKKDRYPVFCKYKEKVHWMGCDEYSDVTEAFNLYCVTGNS